MSAERSVVLRQDREPGDSRYYGARLEANGDLVVEGQDLGSGVESIFGNALREYEWQFRIQAADVPRALEILGAESGEDALATLSRLGADEVDRRIRHDVKEAGIEVNFWSRIGD